MRHIAHHTHCMLALYSLAGGALLPHEKQPERRYERSERPESSYKPESQAQGNSEEHDGNQDLDGAHGDLLHETGAKECAKECRSRCRSE